MTLAEYAVIHSSEGCFTESKGQRYAVNKKANKIRAFGPTWLYHRGLKLILVLYGYTYINQLLNPIAPRVGLLVITVIVYQAKKPREKMCY